MSLGIDNRQLHCQLFISISAGLGNVLIVSRTIEGVARQTELKRRTSTISSSGVGFSEAFQSSVVVIAFHRRWTKRGLPLHRWRRVFFRTFFAHCFYEWKYGLFFHRCNLDILKGVNPCANFIFRCCQFHLDDWLIHFHFLTSISMLTQNSGVGSFNGNYWKKREEHVTNEIDAAEKVMLRRRS